jgi:tripartite-type tricarboxylate transporter receptor subunit TctC
MLVSLAFPAWAQAYPSRPIRLINPFSAGSPVDVVARPIAQRLSDILRQPVTVENRAGAGGTIGADFVAKAPPDGYTLLVSSSSTQVIAPLLKSALPYDATRDFKPLAMMADGPTAVVVHPSLPVKTLDEFIVYALKHPNAIAFASSGPGTLLHISGELFAAKTKVQLLHVPYKGAVPASTDLVGGQVQVMFDSVANSVANVKAGRLRALAVLGRERSPLLPDVPASEELGYLGLSLPAWIGFFAPSGTPSGVIDVLSGALTTIAADGDIRARLQGNGLLPRFLPTRAFEADLVQQTKALGPLLRSINLKLE